MRARVVKEFEAYWNYAVTLFREGAELDGDLARHCVDNAPKGHVEVVEADPEPPAPKQDAGAGDGGEGVPDGSGSGDEPPVDGTIDALMEWVGDSQERAAQALEAEQAKDKPRSTVVKRLTALADSEE
ncbi:hypothetical protein ACFZAR_43030 [Streptomyces sp. NPDC008222]|uniref:hypothetical protein n=1 Tax=Streptomyces sp. NPDC008222 TaxID=3364820 RepID=UPI0036E888FE